MHGYVYRRANLCSRAERKLGQGQVGEEEERETEKKLEKLSAKGHGKRRGERQRCGYGQGATS